MRDGVVAWVGTMNWTVSAFAGNREFALIDTNPTAVRESEAIFAADWDRRAYAGPADALVLSPANSRATLAGLIAGARRTLYLYAEEVDDAGITEALIAAAGRGVRVRMVIAGGGTVSWGWHETTSGSGGTASVTCTLARASATDVATFTVVR